MNHPAMPKSGTTYSERKNAIDTKQVAFADVRTLACQVYRNSATGDFIATYKETVAQQLREEVKRRVLEFELANNLIIDDRANPKVPFTDAAAAAPTPAAPTQQPLPQGAQQMAGQQFMPGQVPPQFAPQQPGAQMAPPMPPGVAPMPPPPPPMPAAPPQQQMAQMPPPPMSMPPPPMMAGQGTPPPPPQQAAPEQGTGRRKKAGSAAAPPPPAPPPPPQAAQGLPPPPQAPGYPQQAPQQYAAPQQQFAPPQQPQFAQPPPPPTPVVQQPQAQAPQIDVGSILQRIDAVGNAVNASAADQGKAVATLQAQLNELRGTVQILTVALHHMYATATELEQFRQGKDLGDAQKFVAFLKPFAPNPQ